MCPPTAARGIGLAIAKGLAAEGCAVHPESRSSENRPGARQVVLTQHGVEVSTGPLDLSNSLNADWLTVRCPDVDLLVDNAGASHL